MDYSEKIVLSSNATSGENFVQVNALVIDTGGFGEMIEVPGGRLQSRSEISPADVATFLIGRTEVTWRDWRVVRSWATSNGYDIADSGGACAEDHPVLGLSWFDAVKWCNARSELEGLDPSIPRMARFTGRASRITQPSTRT